ncbi:MAG: nuclear transport factor 2 family protein [Propionivibrio sp.]
MTNEIVAITDLMARYFDALYRCDTALLEAVFHPEAHYFTASEGSLLHLDMPTYVPIVAARTSPQSTGENCTWQIESVDFAGPVTALVRMRSRMMGKHFIDLLSVVKLDGQWRIIAKVFHFDMVTAATGGA